ncbi:hypothetical protein Val02_17710 [Virgisporangium aliadipatigenens]|uniref:Knr4/Smi1-like domain-containing protein n=1 Tax=Virgisporangium aliadipatigenens TaxID=741659 RepID=A0A8J3YJ11_9ACTN|nr:SMI1/KNR4 family protein [Virgisporangium aliadipatigenens]GIJ44885.1 hypothetical protein Val02_17710 [Virgisporangium aliadipatigenens]
MNEAAFVVTAASSQLPWTVAATALATLRGRTAVVYLSGGRSLPAGDPLRRAAETYLELRATARDPLPAARVAAHVRRLSDTHDLVLICGDEALLVSSGPGSATLSEVAALAGARVLLVVEDSPDGARHAALASAVLSVPLSLAAVGPGDSLERLVARPVARIPHRPPLEPGRIAAAAPTWLSPSLGGAPPPTPTPTATGPTPASRPHGPTVLAVVIAIVVALCMVADYCDVGPFTEDDASHSGSINYDESDLEPEPMRPTAARNCAPTGYPATHTTPDTATTDRVNAAWARIESRLHAIAPSAFGALRPPATPAEVAAVENRVGSALPADVVASLLRHNGVSPAASTFLPPYFDLLDTTGMTDVWGQYCALDDPNWQRHYLPIATGPDATCLFVIAGRGPDANPSLFVYDPEAGPPHTQRDGSLVALLEGVAKSLETGEPHHGDRPALGPNGTLTWGS